MNKIGKWCLGLILCVMAVQAQDTRSAYLYPKTAKFSLQLNRVRSRGIFLLDRHIHLRGGMTPAKAAAREQDSGIGSCVLENYGREWPLHDNATLESFIRMARSVKIDGRTLPVGIQVNDRDWFKQIDPRLLKKLDFVLADTMIMGTTKEGKPQRLWLPDLKIDDPEAWMEKYMAHYLQILSEPITVLANPTYLPDCIADQYDKLWTEERMRKVIALAVKRGIYLEIQAESLYPKPKFLRLAKEMGAKFCFGTNNFDDKVKDLSKWFEAIEWLDLRPGDL